MQAQQTGSSDTMASFKAEAASMGTSGSKSSEDLKDELHDADEAHLGGFVQRLAMVLPRSVKDMCAGLQPTLKTVADGLQLVHDLFTWKDDQSSRGLVGAL